MTHPAADPLPIDQTYPIVGLTYRQMVKELDEAELTLPDWEVSFIGDAVDHPERFRTQAQLKKIVDLWERHIA